MQLGLIGLGKMGGQMVQRVNPNNRLWLWTNPQSNKLVQLNPADLCKT